jgi:hypothetical protein
MILLLLLLLLLWYVSSIHHICVQAAEHDQKAHAFDRLTHELARSTSELENLRQLSAQQSSSLQNLSGLEKELNVRVLDLEKVSQMLRMDKEYLTRELHATAHRADAVEITKDELAFELREAKVMHSSTACIHSQRVLCLIMAEATGGACAAAAGRTRGHTARERATTASRGRESAPGERR